MTSPRERVETLNQIPQVPHMLQVATAFAVELKNVASTGTKSTISTTLPIFCCNTTTFERRVYCTAVAASVKGAPMFGSWP